jgi:hypothetical protein
MNIPQTCYPYALGIWSMSPDLPFGPSERQ